MAVLWPPTIPQMPLIDSYEEVAPNIILRSSVETGAPKVRRRYTAAATQITCRYSLTRAELAIFDDFFFGPAAGGAVQVDWPHPWRHETVRIRFREQPRYSNAGHPDDAWVVAVALEVLPPGIAAALEAVSPGSAA